MIWNHGKQALERIQGISQQPYIQPLNFPLRAMIMKHHF